MIIFRWKASRGGQHSGAHSTSASIHTSWVLMNLSLSIVVSVFLMTLSISAAFRPMLPMKSQIAANTLPMTKSSTRDSSAPFSYSDVLWRILPSPDAPLPQQISSRIQSKLLRLSFALRGQQPPLIVCPDSDQILLETWYNGNRIGRFGIIARPGPTARPIEDTVASIFRSKGKPATAAAIIYMFVEEEYRSRGVGEMALDVIALIQANEGCNYTLLVADDKGSGKLVAWYERNGFKKAPKLQDFLGSPSGQFGVTMIAPTRLQVPDGLRLEW